MLRIVADKIEEIPEGLRESAKQVEGQGFVVPSTNGVFKEGWGIEDFSGLRKMLTDERQGRKAAERALAAFEGLPPDEAASAREALEQFKAGKLRGAKEIDDWKASYEAKTKDERAKIEAKLAKRTEALRDRMLRGELAPVIAAKGGAEAMDAILTLAQQYVRFEETADGEIKTSIVGKDGKPMLTSKASSGDEAGYDELIEQMRAAPATRGLFRAPASGGSGGSSQTGRSGRSADTEIAFSAMTPEELIQRGLSRKPV